jgi:hypothetical protein
MLAPLPLGSPYCISGAREHITWVRDAAPSSSTFGWPVGCEIVRVGLKLAWRGAEGPCPEESSRGPEPEARGREPISVNIVRLIPWLGYVSCGAWHESTAATPASLFLGRDVNHPLALKWKLFELDLDRDSKNLEEFWETALSNLRKARARVASRYNAERRQAEFSVGDLVLLRLHPLSSRSHQRSAKLDWKWSPH